MLVELAEYWALSTANTADAASWGSIGTSLPESARQAARRPYSVSIPKMRRYIGSMKRSRCAGRRHFPLGLPDMRDVEIAWLVCAPQYSRRTCAPMRRPGGAAFTAAR